MAASAPGPNRVPYCVYKGAPEAPMEAHDDCMEIKEQFRYYFHSKGEECCDHRPILTGQFFNAEVKHFLVW